MSGGGAERETENPKHARTVRPEPNVGLELRNHEFMTWSETKSQMFNWLSLPGTQLLFYFCPSIYFFNVYFWERERVRERDRESEQDREGQRERETESEAGSRLCTRTRGSQHRAQLLIREIMTWAEVGRSTNWAIQAPQLITFYNSYLLLPNKPPPNLVV